MVRNETDSHKLDAAIGAAQQALTAAQALLSAVKASLPVESVRWVDICAYSPLTKRTTLAAARSGLIEGARKKGRKWVATAEAMDAWLTGQTEPAEPTEVSTVLARWQARRVA